ncbi:unnamed protein product [Protopolystoma xenopodis]|uniref:Uncharacterized protein n=1 Tax=Protopolystoma xenopodis TaxID=117903 RepID=A0A3S5BSN3_9PLAT|nr:unnamed protein product [Protopolystoma xenopodis]
MTSPSVSLSQMASLLVTQPSASSNPGSAAPPAIGHLLARLVQAARLPQPDSVVTASNQSSSGASTSMAPRGPEVACISSKPASLPNDHLAPVPSVVGSPTPSTQTKVAETYAQAWTGRLLRQFRGLFRPMLAPWRVEDGLSSCPLDDPRRERRLGNLTARTDALGESQYAEDGQEETAHVGDVYRCLADKEATSQHLFRQLLIRLDHEDAELMRRLADSAADRPEDGACRLRLLDEESIVVKCCKTGGLSDELGGCNQFV